MKGKISISPKNRLTTMPVAWVKEGYSGQVPYIANASTIILIHPKANLRDVEESLKLLIRDVQLRQKLGLLLQKSKQPKQEE